MGSGCSLARRWLAARVPKYVLIAEVGLLSVSLMLADFGGRPGPRFRGAVGAVSSSLEAIKGRSLVACEVRGGVCGSEGELNDVGIGSG